MNVTQEKHQFSAFKFCQTLFLYFETMPIIWKVQMGSLDKYQENENFVLKLSEKYKWISWKSKF